MSDTLCSVGYIVSSVLPEQFGLYIADLVCCPDIYECITPSKEFSTVLLLITPVKVQDHLAAALSNVRFVTVLMEEVLGMMHKPSFLQILASILLSQ
jgi:hypothetical protein